MHTLLPITRRIKWEMRKMATVAQTKWVYDFADGGREMRELLGGKG
jgi:hypothetical protein